MITSIVIRLRPSSRVVVLTILSTLTMWLGQGCARVNNDRVSIGGEPVPALAPSDPSRTLTPASGPSLTHGARDGWPRDVLRVPVDGVEHLPRYTRAQPNYTATPRATGRHPTAESALDLDADRGALVWEAIAAPFHAAADIVLFIPRAIESPPGRVVRSPAEPMQRTH